MDVTSAILTGFKQIWAHKFRSVLTMFGIVLGVCSLVAMSAVVKGMENGLKEALVAMGGLEKIEIEQSDELPDYQRHLADQAVGVRLRDVYALQSGAPLLKEITPSIDRHGWRGGMTLSYRGKRTRPHMFSGTWPSALDVHEHKIAYGRMFNQVDEDMARSVCVIGTGVRDDLFGAPEEVGQEINPVGQQILVGEQPFTIIGMFEHYESDQARRARLEAMKNPTKETGPQRSRGWGGGDHFAFRLKNNTVLVPLRTMVMKLSATESDEDRDSTSTETAASVVDPADPQLSTLTVRIPDIEVLEPALQQARNVLMVTHRGIEDFAFTTQEDWAQEVTIQIKNARVSRSIIAAICLIVGGIGIMNIMLASISERVREIGIRKAVGATTAAVFNQILIESLVLAMIGGVMGLLLSVARVQTIAAFTPTDNAPEITLISMGLAFAFSVMIGIAAGLFPAIKASKRHPIQALRYD